MYVYTYANVCPHPDTVLLFRVYISKCVCIVYIMKMYICMAHV